MARICGQDWWAEVVVRIWWPGAVPGSMTRIGGRNGGQEWWLGLVTTSDGQDRWPELMARISDQGWWPGVVTRIDGQAQEWYSRLVARTE